MGDAAHDLNALAANPGLTFEEAAAKLTARETTGRATVEPRPETEAPAMEWPTEKWKGSPEELSRKRFAIIAYLRRVWKPFIENNNVIVTREILKERDADAASALRGYLQYHEFPKDIRILTSDQLRDHLTKQPIWPELTKRPSDKHKRTQPERAQAGIQRKQWIVDFRRSAGW